MMIIERSEAKEIKQINKWLLLFGRRKTGKTFLVTNFIPHEEYFFVKRDRSIISKKDQQEIPYDTFITLLQRELANGKTIVVDEFHRLDEGFFDFIHYIEKKGKLILISSTLHLSKKLLSSQSPLLGFFAEIPITLLSLQDTLQHLKQYHLNKKSLLEMAILLREPLMIDYFEKTKNPRHMLAQIIKQSIQTVPALIGEIFIEEERSISAVYEGILRAIANGKTVSGEISSYLFSRKLLKKDDPSLIQQYLKNLMAFGIIKRLKVYKKNKHVYKHISPLSRIYYYTDEKYNISERKPNQRELLRIIDKIMPLLVEDNIRELIATIHDLEEAIYEAKDFDVDGCLLRFTKPEIALEVKWSNNIPLASINKSLDTVQSKKKVLFVPDKKRITKSVDSLQIIDIEDVIKKISS